jgi:hypothetical protein
MNLRTVFAAAGLFAMIPACAATSSDASSSTSSALGADVVLEGSVATGESVTVSYQPSDYPEATAPFIGVRLTDGARAASGKSSATIHVEGEFPGTPRVLVVDDAFRVVASAAGASARVVVPSAADARMVLVRDDLWVRPMPFTITVEQ